MGMMEPNPFLNACVLALLLAASAASGATAQVVSPPPAASGDTVTLSLAEAQRLALTRNPAFLADRQESAIARGELRQARVYRFNPDVELRTPGAAAGGLRDYELFVGQEVEWAGQRGLRIRAARRGSERADAAVRNAARTALTAASEAYYTALAAARRLEVAREIARLNQQLLQATRTQAREGEISTLDANLAEIELGRARARVLGAEREAVSARLALQRQLGIGPDTVVRLQDAVPAGPSPSELDADSLLARALERRPDLHAAARAVEQRRALAQLAQRAAIPNLRLGALAERDPAGGSPRLGFGVNLGLPLWNRNQGEVAARAAEAEQARLQRGATELQVRTEVEDAVRSYRTAHEEARIYQQDVLEPARQNQRLLEMAYRAGKINLATLLLVRNQLLDAETGYWDAWLAERRALVALQAATATLDASAALTPRAERATP